MNKISSAIVALILAIPAGFLSYLLVGAMLDHFRNMATVMRILTSVTLTFSALGTVLPLGILIFTKTAVEDDEETETDAKDSEEKTAADTDGLVASDENLASDEDPSVVIDAFKDADLEADAGTGTDATDAEESMEQSVVIETEGMLDDIYEADLAEDFTDDFTDEAAEEEQKEEEQPEPKKRWGRKKKKKKKKKK